MTEFPYQVKALRSLGLDCKWKNRFIIARSKYTDGKYYPVTKNIWERAKRKKGGIEKNIIDVFDGAYLLIDIFHI